jgi:hypothetical protein
LTLQAACAQSIAGRFFATNVWVARFAAIRFREAMYDMGEFAAVRKPAIEQLQPEPLSAIAFSSGEARDRLDYKVMRDLGS